MTKREDQMLPGPTEVDAMAEALLRDWRDWVPPSVVRQCDETGRLKGLGESPILDTLRRTKARQRRQAWVRAGQRFAANVAAFGAGWGIVELVRWWVR